MPHSQLCPGEGNVLSHESRRVARWGYLSQRYLKLYLRSVNGGDGADARVAVNQTDAEALSHRGLNHANNVLRPVVTQTDRLTTSPIAFSQQDNVHGCRFTLSRGRNRRHQEHVD